tara:strand:+ start:367 stop:555 length:189 start_codon:yes stop_codon:yes gene_type:complete
MPLSSYRMHRIFIAAKMVYGLGSYNSEEINYYNIIRIDMDDIRKESVKKGVPFIKIYAMELI